MGNREAKRMNVIDGRLSNVLFFILLFYTCSLAKCFDLGLNFEIDINFYQSFYLLSFVGIHVNLSYMQDFCDVQ